MTITDGATTTRAAESAPTAGTPVGERADLVKTLAAHRGFLRQTVGGLSDEQAVQRTTASELCLGGLVKHVAATEAQWADFIERGAQAMKATDDSQAEWAGNFQLLAGETLAAILERYAEVAARTDALVTNLPDLDVAHALPAAPWFEPGASWSARRVLLHILAETAQHAGHADILRESLDGAKTMG